MDSRRQQHMARRSCLRCRSQKRKCDREFPKCSVCIRLEKDCKYAEPISPQSMTASPKHKPGLTVGLAPPDVKAEIAKSLSGFNPEDIVTKYLSSLHPWLPIIPDSRLSNGISASWEDATVDFTLLGFTIHLLISEPEVVQGDDSLSPKLHLAYLFCKSWTALLEAAGLNSLDLIRSKLVLTLFEVAHGLYPAAFISFGAVIGAADAFTDYNGCNVSMARSTNKGTVEEECMISSAIAITDRYITVENSKWPSLTRGRSLLGQPLVSPHSTSVTLNSNQAFSRLFEASSLLEKVHKTLNEPTRHQSFNVEELAVIVQTLKSFEAVLQQEIPERLNFYSGALALCRIGLVYAYDNGTKTDPNKIDGACCRAGARSALDSFLDAKLALLQPYLEGNETIDFKILPPFLVYLVYKCAAIVTERLRVGEESLLNFNALKGLRGFLALLSQRWLAAKRYLRLLDEETTPRMMKAIQ
ncbi:hypothetical protein B0O99DRAFT_644030 [Bisporella sp. PMI_857]|nr:hypothetical protein B0O99DRAFT_644030 [Bisporella sp. PMI_857]